MNWSASIVSRNCSARKANRRERFTLLEQYQHIPAGNIECTKTIVLAQNREMEEVGIKSSRPFEISDIKASLQHTLNLRHDLILAALRPASPTVLDLVQERGHLLHPVRMFDGYVVLLSRVIDEVIELRFRIVPQFCIGVSVQLGAVARYD